MKLIIAGGRNYLLTREDYRKLDILRISQGGFTEIVCGGAKGADQGGKEYGESRWIPIKIFKAEWYKFGKPASYIRNYEMAKYADAVVLFPGNKGTNNMHTIAVEENLIIYDYRED